MSKGLTIMEAKMEKYLQKIDIRSYDTDQQGKASICSLFHFMLEAAWAHAQVMDWGYDQLHSNHMFWVLSRLYVVVEKYPSWQDTITLKTWSAGTDGVYAYREFIIEDADGRVLLRANTAWLILETETKKIVLLRDHISTFPRYHKTGSCREPRRIRPGKSTKSHDFTPVRFSELDINAHFNSVKAMERVLDQFSIEFLDAHEPESVEVNYLKEGFAGDRLAVSVEQAEPNSCLATIIRESGHANLSVMKINWRPRQVDLRNS